MTPISFSFLFMNPLFTLMSSMYTQSIHALVIFNFFIIMLFTLLSIFQYNLEYNQINLMFSNSNFIFKNDFYISKQKSI